MKQTTMNTDGKIVKKTKLYSSKDPNKKPTIKGLIISIVTAPLWIIAGVGMFVCVIIGIICLVLYNFAKILSN